MFLVLAQISRVSSTWDTEYGCMFRGLVKDLWSDLSAAPKAALACLLQTKVWESILWKISRLLHTPTPKSHAFPQGQVIISANTVWSLSWSRKNWGQRTEVSEMPDQVSPRQKGVIVWSSCSQWAWYIREGVSVSAGHRCWGPSMSFPLSPSLHS